MDFKTEGHQTIAYNQQRRHSQDFTVSDLHTALHSVSWLQVVGKWTFTFISTHTGLVGTKA